MKKLIIFSIFFVSILQSIAQENKLMCRYSEQQLLNILNTTENFHPFPKLSDREAWQKADQGMLKFYLKEAEKNIDYEWPTIPATQSLLIERTGNRTGYQKMRSERRSVLTSMLFAEIYENKGRFIDQIINGIWSTCEESYWGVSAHLPTGAQYKGLADIEDPFLDLFAAETASLLALTNYFLGDKLDAVSPQIRARIYYETNKRIFSPLMNKPHWWMGEKFGGHRLNNWVPWICSNCLCAALLLEKEKEKKATVVYRITELLEEYTKHYPEDGGCDEGPGYWDAAPGSLFDNITLLNQGTNNAYGYVLESTKVKNMVKYIYRFQIGNGFCVNFADGAPKTPIDGGMLYRFGKAVNDKDAMAMGALYYKKRAIKIPNAHIFRSFYELFLDDEINKTEEYSPLPKDAWFPDLQVMTARDKGKSTEGFFVAAKGGHNDESHNHNDIGNFIVYYNSLPLLIDVGSGTYTKRTFIPERRYELWNNCSEYHNLPTINNSNQLPGKQYKAVNVKYKSTKNTAQLSLDISKAYPENTGIKSLTRNIQLQRGKKVILKDIFELSEAKQISEHFMTVYPAEVLKPGKLAIHYKNDDETITDFIIQYDAKKMTPKIEKQKLETVEDKGIIKKWKGYNIYRITFEIKAPQQNEQALFSVYKKK